MDETYVKMGGKWAYLYRAVGKDGASIDCYLSQTRNAKAATRFLGKALRGRRPWEAPQVINTDKAGFYEAPIKTLKKEGKLTPETKHRQAKYLNNVIEADHGKLKRQIKPTLGFKRMKTAYATIKGFEAMWAIKKKQAAVFQLQKGAAGEVRLVERTFRVGKTALQEVIELISQELGEATT